VKVKVKVMAKEGGGEGEESKRRTTHAPTIDRRSGEETRGDPGDRRLAIKVIALFSEK